MNHVYKTSVGFAHAVRYRDMTIHAWAARTGHYGNGAYAYTPEELPPYIDPPTNEERGRAEAFLFQTEPIPYGESYLAYLSAAKPDQVAKYGPLSKGVITTFNGELLAIVTRITSYRTTSDMTDSRGSFWARGIDGRVYYGTHNGRGVYCRMRLAKWVDEFDIQQHTAYGWETVTSETTSREARAQLNTYRINSPGTYRIKHRQVRQC